MKRNPTVLNLNVSNNFNFDSLKNTNLKLENSIKDIVINETYKAIEYGVKTNKKKVAIFEIIDTRAQINLERTQWKKTLNEIIIPYFCSKEDYEKCTYIQKSLITKL